MFSKSVLCLTVGVFLVPTVQADTIQLKDKAAVTGKILAEKRDQLDLDLGYTVLTIPRDQIVKVLKSNEATAQPSAKPAGVDKSSPASETTSSGMYVSPTKPGPARDVRDLVKQIGEAVVQGGAARREL